MIKLYHNVTQCFDDLLPGDPSCAQHQHVEGGQDGERGEQTVASALLSHLVLNHGHGEVPDCIRGTDIIQFLYTLNVTK